MNIILRPRITEKAGMANESLNVFTFEVAAHATKQTIAKAIKDAYKVTPLKIRTITLPRTKIFSRGRSGMQSSIKKALVFLKKGDKIDIA